MICVWWQLEHGSVLVAVKDGGGPTLPEPAELNQWTTGGRGLRIVERLARHWGARCDDDGTTVWAEILAPQLSQVGLSAAASGGG